MLSRKLKTFFLTGFLATGRIWVLKNMCMWGDLDVSMNINASTIKTSLLTIPNATKNKIK